MVEFKFPVHPSYKRYISQVNKMRDVLEGSDIIKANTTTYLPRLKAQSDLAYKAYVYRALFFNSTARIRNTNVGTIVRRAPTINTSPDMKPYFSEDSMSKYSFRELFRATISELVSVSRVGVLVDIDPLLDMPIPLIVYTEFIINWVKDEYGNVTSVLLAMPSTTVNSITFESESKLEYYRLTVVDGVYTIYVYDEDAELIDTKQPSLRGKKLSYIPFYPANSFGLDIEPMSSPLIDVAEVNLSHYRTSADLETGRHFCGLPQPIVTGGVADTELYVGSEEAWVIPNDKAKAFYLEFIGQGLDGLARALKEKESQMAQFSAQLMDTGSKGSEAEGTVRMRYSSDAANLYTITISDEELLNKTYGCIADWQGEKKPEIELNKDFISDKLSFNDLRELTKSWFDGAISDEEYRYNLKRGEVLPINETLDQTNTSPQKKKLETSKPKTTTEEE